MNAHEIHPLVAASNAINDPSRGARRRCLLLLLSPIMAWVLSPNAGFGQEKKLEPMRGVNRGQIQLPVATLLIGVNETVGGIAEPGWPLIVSAVRLPDGKPTTAPLPSNLKLKLTNQKDAEVAVSFESVSQPASAQAEGILYWLAAEAATSRLAAGRYRVSLIPEQNQLTGWRLEFGEFQVVAPNPERSGQVGHLKVQRWIILGKADDALAEADRLIAANAKDRQAWITKGDILMMKDDPDAATEVYDHALSLYKKTEGEPLAIMTRRRSAFFRSLEKRGVVPAPPAPR